MGEQQLAKTLYYFISQLKNGIHRAREAFRMGELPPTVYELNANRWIFPYRHFVDLHLFPAVQKATKNTKTDWEQFDILTMLPEKISNWLSGGSN